MAEIERLQQQVELLTTELLKLKDLNNKALQAKKELDGYQMPKELDKIIKAQFDKRAYWRGGEEY